MKIVVMAIMSGGSLIETSKEQITARAYACIEKPVDLSHIREGAERVAAASMPQ